MKTPLPARALVLAPMVELSHRALRELIYDFGGLDLAFTEMASAGALTAGTPYERWYFDPEPRPEATIYQFYTTKPERLPEALEKVKERPVFGADINFGCSAPHITRAGGGAAWMREPEKAFALVASARRVWDKNLSVKLRVGREDDYPALLDFCRGLVAAGVDFITLHPRLEGEKFRRTGRWDYVGRLARDLPVPVLGNGDVRSPKDYRSRMADESPAGLMIGREAARRPWIFALIRGLEADPGFELPVELEAVAGRYLDLVEARLPQDFHLSRCRRFFFYYCDNFSFSHHVKWRIQNAPDLAAIRQALADYFAEVPADRRRVERG